jgi:hypothetical protein
MEGSRRDRQKNPQALWEEGRLDLKTGSVASPDGVWLRCTGVGGF